MEKNERWEHVYSYDVIGTLDYYVMTVPPPILGRLTSEMRNEDEANKLIK